MMAPFHAHTEHGLTCSQHITLESNYQLIRVSWNHYATLVARKSLQITYTCPFGLPICDCFTTLPSWFTELQLVLTMTNTCLFAPFFISSSKPSLLLTTGNHWLWFWPWFLSFHCMWLIMNFAQVTPGFSLIPAGVSPASTHVLSLISLGVRGQMSSLLQKSPEFSLLFAPSVQPYRKSILGLGPFLRSRIELSHWGPGAQDGTTSDKDKGLLKVPWAAYFHPLQHTPWVPLSLHG